MAFFMWFNGNADMPSEFLSPSLVERKSRFLSHIMSGSYRYSGRESILFFQTNFLAPESVPCRTVYRILSTPPQTDRQTAPLPVPVPVQSMLAHPKSLARDN